MSDEGNHHQRAEQVAQCGGNIEGQFQRIRHDRRFKGKKDESEGGVDQRSQRRPDIAEARAARQQIHIHAIAGRVITDRQAGQEDDQPREQHCQRRIGEAVTHQQRRAHRFQHEKGRIAKRHVGDPKFRPLAEALRREAQRIVFERLVRHPGVVVAAHLDDALERGSRGRGSRGHGIGHGAIIARAASDLTALCTPYAI